jgi:hypothetical protein
VVVKRGGGGPAGARLSGFGHRAPAHGAGSGMGSLNVARPKKEKGKWSQPS